MSEAGESRVCSGCGQWAVWTPQHRKGAVFCCEGCARGPGCNCVKGADVGIRRSSERRGLHRGGQHGLAESVAAQAPRA